MEATSSAHCTHTQENLLYGSEDWNCTISIASPSLASKRYIINFYVGGIVTSKGSVLPRGGAPTHTQTHTQTHTHALITHANAHCTHTHTHTHTHTRHAHKHMHIHTHSLPAWTLNISCTKGIKYRAFY